MVPVRSGRSAAQRPPSADGPRPRTVTVFAGGSEKTAPALAAAAGERAAGLQLWTELWARCEGIVQDRRNYAQDSQSSRKFRVVARANSGEHLLARESAERRKRGPSGGFRPIGKRYEDLGPSGLWTLDRSGSRGLRPLRIGGGGSSGLTPMRRRPSGRGTAPHGPSRGLERSGRRVQRSGMGGLFGGSLSGADDRVALQFLIIGLEGVGQTLSVIFQRWPLPFPVSGGWSIRDGRTFTGPAKSPDTGGSLADRRGQRERLFGGCFLEASGRRACPAPPSERELVPRSHARARSGRAVCSGLAHSTTG